MEEGERARLEATGYAVVDDAADWLDLTDVERRMVEIRRRRVSVGLSQTQPAERKGPLKPESPRPRPRRRAWPWT